MMNFAVWNVQKKPLSQLLAALALEHDLDVLFILESALELKNPATIRATGLVNHPAPNRFGVFARPEFRVASMTPAFLSGRAHFLSLTCPGGTEIHIGLVHGFDQRNYRHEETRALFFSRVLGQMRIFEAECGHKRSIIVGDFNANPYYSSIVSANGLHALGVQEIRGATARIIMGEPHDFYYNPMWRCFGQGRDAGSATYYFHGYDAVEPL